MKRQFFIAALLLLYFFVDTSLGAMNLTMARDTIDTPVNDSPCITDSFPPYDLGTGGSHSGTTCGATGYNNDSLSDVKNVQCSSVTDDNAVWYIVKPAPEYDGISIVVSSTGIGDNSSVEVFAGDSGAFCEGGEGALFKKAKCDGLPVTDMQVGCIEDGQFFFIKVSSSEGDCGSFQIEVTSVNLSDCGVADKCEDITSDQTLEPITQSTLEGKCLQGCLDLACPDPYVLGQCNYSKNPTVWYKVITDADATQLYSAVTTAGFWTPIWSVFAPAPDCDSLINVSSEGSDNNCSLEAMPAAPPFVSKVKGNSTYYIAVSADPEGAPIDDTGFEICVATLNNSYRVTCLGYEEGCGNDETLVFKITSREHPELEEEYDSLTGYMGPFCPGEEVTIEMSFVYDATKTGSDWFLGFIPEFGNGWNIDDFDFNAYLPTATGPYGGEAQWYDSSDPDCAPLATESFPYLCTYKDDAGTLHLYDRYCNYTYPEPCTDSIAEGDTLPSGYFWTSSGTLPDCDTSQCSPAYHSGVGTTISAVSWTFNIKVKEFESEEECMENNDLRIVFNTFSDGGAGCWEDNEAECLNDRLQSSPWWKVNCAIVPDLITENDNICSGETTNINVRIDGDGTDTIEVTFIDNPNITGEKNHIFPGGSGVITDTLTMVNESTYVPDTVYYMVRVATPSCTVKIDTIEVQILPKPVIEIDTVINISDAGPGSITIHSNDKYTYHWTGPGGFESDKASIFGLENAGEYILEVKDTATNCTADTVIEVKDITAVGDLMETKVQVNLFPNPSKEIVYMQFGAGMPEDENVRIYEITGKTAMRFSIDKDTKLYKLDISKLTPGVYIIMLKGRKYHTYKRLIVY